MSVSINDQKNSWDKIVKEASKNKKAYTKVGWQRKDGAIEKTESGKKKVLTVDVAISNEFGTSSIPSRPFVRSYYDKHKNKIAKISKNLYMDVLLGKKTHKKALAMLGEYVKGGIQKNIRHGNFKPNADSTIRQKTVNGKKGDTPLINTGQMRASITHEEVMGK